MIYKKGMYFKKTQKSTGRYVIGRLINPVYNDIPTYISQDWIVEVYENHSYLSDGEVILVIPTGDAERHEVKIYRDYVSLMAGIL